MKNFCVKMGNWLCSDSKRIIRICVLIVCCIVVIIQLTDCFLKLRYPPRATHSQYNINDTLVPPAITVCRNPPYKIEVLNKFNLNGYPNLQNIWQDFDFSEGNIERMFNESTYSYNETFWGASLSVFDYNLEWKSSLHLVNGLCFTFVPKIRINITKDAGYSLQFGYSNDGEELIKGWNVFIHESKEDFHEIKMMSLGRAEQVFVKPGEQVEVKIVPTQISMISNAERTCVGDFGYSATKCSEMCVWKNITSQMGCSGPWMPGINLHTCNTTRSMNKLTTLYGLEYNNTAVTDCNCEGACESTLYSSYIISRFFSEQYVNYIDLRLYYTSNLVTMHEERPGYDLSQFVADLGGSLGFLLGLSVLGIIEILEKITFLIFGECKNKNDFKEKTEDGVECAQVTH